MFFRFSSAPCPLSSRPFRGGEIPWDDKLEQPWSRSFPVKMDRQVFEIMIDVDRHVEYQSLFNMLFWLRFHPRTNPKSVPLGKLSSQGVVELSCSKGGRENGENGLGIWM